MTLLESGSWRGTVRCGHALLTGVHKHHNSVNNNLRTDLRFTRNWRFEQFQRSVELIIKASC